MCINFPYSIIIVVVAVIIFYSGANLTHTYTICSSFMDVRGGNEQPSVHVLYNKLVFIRLYVPPYPYFPTSTSNFKFQLSTITPLCIYDIQVQHIIKMLFYIKKSILYFQYTIYVCHERIYIVNIIISYLHIKKLPWQGIPSHYLAVHLL